MDVDEGAGAESPLLHPERVADRTRRQYRGGGRGRRENSREWRGGAILLFDAVVEDEEPMWELEGPSAVMSPRDALAACREREGPLELRSFVKFPEVCFGKRSA